MRKIIEVFRRFVNSFGFDVVRYSPRNDLVKVRERVLKDLDISLVLDVGANEGLYGQQLRDTGYRGKIVSFEPLKEPFDKLMHRSGLDKDWICRKEALGDVNGIARIHVGNRSSISSMLAMHPSLAEIAPELGMFDQEDTAVARLDCLWEDLCVSERSGNVYLKIDVQGFECQVLEGCAGVLDRVSAVEIELSLRELYKGQCLIDEALCWLRTHGFTCVHIEPSFVDHRRGHILQMDGIFLRLDKHGVPVERDSQP